MVTDRSSLFFFNDTATTEIYTLSLHDALPIFGVIPASRTLRICASHSFSTSASTRLRPRRRRSRLSGPPANRSEEHTSELQSRLHLVCRLLLEKKNKMA